MRKKTIRMMMIAGVAALLLPTAAMAEWDQHETHENQKNHDAMITRATTVHSLGNFRYGQLSSIGYDYKGDGSEAVLKTSSPYEKKGQSPWNTTPCPIQMADTVSPYTWEAAMGKCPAQAQAAGWTMGQTDKGFAEGDNELFGPILDDLYQTLSETAYTTKNENGVEAFKKVDQVLDILFYRANTVGEVYGADGWTDEAGDVHWFGGLGFDQTLDQDVADISGTGNGTVLADAIADPNNKPHGTWLWNFDHIAQTFYQDFRLWDKGNTFGGVGDKYNYTTGSFDGAINYESGKGTGDWIDLASGANSALGTASKYLRGQNNPRNRHGIELLATGDNSMMDTNQYTGPSETVTWIDAPGWGDMYGNSKDFAGFDQWVIQSMRDNYDLAYTQNYVGPPATTVDWTGTVALSQSYSSWMALGEPGDLCDSINEDTATATSVGCEYTYKKVGHEVDKKIDNSTSSHQTGDP